jgi:hypothetical protein
VRRVLNQPRWPARRLIRLVLYAFLVTFLAARIVVLAIMSHWAPDLYLHVGGTHIHHLNYGIVLLAAVGGYLVFVRPAGRELQAAAIVYAVGLGLTFDEFGMWLHLGGPYWQRASFDAVVVIAALLALLAYVPFERLWRRRRWRAALALVLSLLLFGWLFTRSLTWADRRFGAGLQQIELGGPE